MRIALHLTNMAPYLAPTISPSSDIDNQIIIDEIYVNEMKMATGMPQ